MYFYVLFSVDRLGRQLLPLLSKHTVNEVPKKWKTELVFNTYQIT